MIRKLARLIKAEYPFIIINTTEEKRIINVLRELAVASDKKFVTADITNGMVGLEESPTPQNTNVVTNDSRFVDMMDAICNYHDNIPTMFVVKDMDVYSNVYTSAIRQVMEVASNFDGSPHILVAVWTGTEPIPAKWMDIATVVDYPLPDYEELNSVLQDLLGSLDPERYKINLAEGSRQNIVQSLSGLTIMQATNALASAVVETGKVDEGLIPYVIEEKESIVKKGGVLEYIRSTVSKDDIGGLDNLKSYMDIRRRLLSEDARSYGVAPPKGVLLYGLPGTGKSTAVKAAAGDLMPLLRLDIGALFGKYVGESEAHARRAIQFAETVAPCVLWIDEIDKGFSQTDSEAGGDNGTTKRVLSTLLTWMEERKKPVYIVATTNYADKLDAALISRFDDVFFLGLPGVETRKDILKIHLRKRGHLDPDIDIDRLASMCRSYTGREIERAVNTAIGKAFIDAKPIVTTGHLVEALSKIKPDSAKSADKLTKMREWANDSSVIWAGEPLETEPVEEVKRFQRLGKEKVGF